MKSVRVMSVLAILILPLPALLAQQGAAPAKYHAWWHDPNVGQPLKSPDARALPLIRADGVRGVLQEGHAREPGTVAPELSNERSRESHALRVL